LFRPVGPLQLFLTRGADIRRAVHPTTQVSGGSEILLSSRKESIFGAGVLPAGQDVCHAGVGRHRAPARDQERNQLVDATEARRLGYQSSGEVAEMLGVTLRTLRYYEEQGLVTPSRTDKGTRYYSDFAVQRLEVCVRLAAVGVPIKTLRQLATIRPSSATGEESSHQLAEVFASIRADLRASLANLRYLLSDLEKTERLVRTCWDCPLRPNRTDCPDCPCEQQIDSAFILHLTWDDNRPEPVEPHLSQAARALTPPDPPTPDAQRLEH
jgi:DNA-binding transcriptional MerR regulator